MKLSLSWLSDFVDLDGLAVEDLVHRLTMSTCEVEEYFDTFPHLERLIIAEVRQCEKHPDSDHLSRCVVFDGTTELSVICGASNVRAGIRVAFAPVGAVVPLKEGGELRIEKRKIRGVLSEGMICSAKELQLEGILGDNGGILILDELPDEIVRFAQNRKAKHSTGTKPKRTPASSSKKPTGAKVEPVGAEIPAPGSPLTELFPYNDTVLDIDNKSITHRPDLWSHVGFAREIAAIFRRKLRLAPPAADTKKPAGKQVSGKIIQIESDSDGDSALVYQGLSCEDVLVTASPLWMRLRLQAIGQKSINNIVDASNYVMNEMGQPNHCFDADILKHKEITCAPAKKPFHFLALDGETYALPPGAVLIYDGSSEAGQPVALGGVIGGANSAIQDSTRRIFIESATFPRSRIRRALSAGAPRTESARRFEKGQDPVNAEAAIYRIVELLRETSPGLIHGKLCEARTIDKKPRRNRIRVSLDFMRRRLGFELTARELVDILHRLHFEVTEEKSKDFTILVPSFRSWHDVQIPEDIVEEVGRIYGYDNIPPVPAPVAVEEPIPNRRRQFERLLKELMIHRAGFTETMNYSFTSPEDNRLWGLEGLTLRNPVQAEKDRMRVSQIPGLVDQAIFNQDRFRTVSLFELGRIFLPRRNELPEEPVRLSFIHLDTVGAQSPSTSETPGLDAFLRIRSALEQVLASAGLPFRLAVPEKPAFYLHPGCQVAFLDEGRLLGIMGILHPAFARARGIKRDVAIAGDFDFERLYSLWEANRRANRYHPPSVFPWSDFDLTLLLDEHASTAGPAGIIESQNFPEFRGIEILSFYRGEPIPAGKMAVSYRVTLGSDQESIAHDRLQRILAQCVEALSGAGYSLRG